MKPPEQVVHNLAEGLEFAEAKGFPMMLFPHFTVGYIPGTPAFEATELQTLLAKALDLSPTQQVTMRRVRNDQKLIDQIAERQRKADERRADSYAQQQPSNPTPAALASTGNSRPSVGPSQEALCG